MHNNVYATQRTPLDLVTASHWKKRNSRQAANAQVTMHLYHSVYIVTCVEASRAWITSEKTVCTLPNQAKSWIGWVECSKKEFESKLPKHLVKHVDIPLCSPATVYHKSGIKIAAKRIVMWNTLVHKRDIYEPREVLRLRTQTSWLGKLINTWILHLVLYLGRFSPKSISCFTSCLIVASSFPCTETVFSCPKSPAKQVNSTSHR